VQKGGSWGRRGVAAEVSILYEMAKSGNGALANLAAPLHTSQCHRATPISTIGVADELPVHYRGGVGKSAKRRVGGGT
jgi:hypothetical protein